MKKLEFRENSHGHAFITIEDDPRCYHCGFIDISNILSALSDRIRNQLADGCTIFLLGHKQINKIKSILLTNFNQEYKSDYINT